MKLRYKKQYLEIYFSNLLSQFFFNVKMSFKVILL